MPKLTTAGPLLGLLVLALWLAPAAGAQLPESEAELERYLVADGETVELANGRGFARIAGRGVVLGGVGRGRVRIRDLPDAKGTDIVVRGAEWSRAVDERTTVYGGRGLRFRALGGAWAVRIVGRRLNATAAGRGTLTLKGTAGTFRIGDGDVRDWPDTRTTYRFG